MLISLMDSCSSGKTSEIGVVFGMNRHFIVAGHENKLNLEFAQKGANLGGLLDVCE
jgi:hypothetical protein